MCDHRLGLDEVGTGSRGETLMPDPCFPLPFLDVLMVLEEELGPGLEVGVLPWLPEGKVVMSKGGGDLIEVGEDDACAFW